MNSFTFNGISSADMGLIVENKDIYSLPARDISLVSVPGRNGDVIIDNNRWQNVTISYTVGIKNIKFVAWATCCSIPIIKVRRNIKIVPPPIPVPLTIPEIKPINVSNIIINLLSVSALYNHFIWCIY